MSEPKKHHFIPQCYLKGFQYGNSKTPKIIIYNKHSMEIHITPINRTACKEDFHTVQHEGESNRSIIEEMLSKYENSLIKRLRKVVKTHHIDSKDKYALSKMMLMLWCRRPKIAYSYKAFFQQNLEAIAELYFQKIQINVYNNCYVKNFIEFFNNKGIIRRIYTMNFSLLEAPENEYFLCSDSPVSFYNQSFENETLKTDIFFPLNKNYGLLCSVSEVLPYRKLTAEEVDGFNINTVAYADEWVYSSCKDDSIKLMIEAAKKYSHV